IAKEDLPFGGTWTFTLADAPGGGTQLTLTEDGTINPPIFRAMAKWFIGLDATQKDFIANLTKHLNAK
ncbi:MAG: polyketide cyclase, partial [Opitutaceae bacterium]